MGRYWPDREGGAIRRELPRTRDQSIDLRGSSRIAIEDSLSLPCRDGHRIERRELRGGRYRVQALEAGAQGAQALGGLQPRPDRVPGRCARGALTATTRRAILVEIDRCSGT